MNDNKNNRVIRAHVLKARTLSPAGFYFPWVDSPAKYSSPGRIPGSSNRPMTVSEKWCRGGVLCSRTRPVNFAVESPISVGSGRYFFKWTADFETAGRGVRKRNSTAFDNCPAAFPSPERVLGWGSACSGRIPPGARAAPALFWAPTFAGNPPSPAVPPASAARPPGFVSGGVALRRSLSHISRCAACNPISHFLVDSLKEAAVEKQNKGYCFISSFGFRVLTGMPLHI